MKTANANGLFSKTRFDGAGRAVFSYTTFDADESTYSDAADVTGDTVIEQSQVVYDPNGNAIASFSFSRLDNDTTSTGELTAANSYAAGSVNWFDQGGRLTTSVNYGHESGNGTRYLFNTDGSFRLNEDGILIEAAGTPPAPNTSDDYIVAQYLYNDAGRMYHAVDNLGRITETRFDALGRTTKTIENYVDGVAGETETTTDRTTEYIYDTAGRLSIQRALNPKGTGNGVENQIGRAHV